MPSILLTGPAAEPVTLAEAKLFLRVEHDDEDDLIEALIAGSRIHVEAQTHRALITQTWRLVRDAWPDSGRLGVLPVPLASIVAARTYDSGGTAHTFDTAAFTLDKASAPALLAFTPGALPVPGRATAGIEVDITAGYGASAASVPEPLRQAIRLLTAHWYENRGVVTAGSEAARLPLTVAALIAPYRVFSL